LVIALGGYLSSLLVMTSHSLAEKVLTHTQTYSGIFIIITAFTILVALGLLMIANRLNRILI